MSEIIKPVPAYEAKIKTFEEPIMVIIWSSRRNPHPTRGTLTATRYQEYARVAIWHPLLKDATGDIAGDTPMEDVYVPYHRYASTLHELNKVKNEYQALLTTQVEGGAREESRGDAPTTTS